MGRLRRASTTASINIRDLYRIGAMVDDKITTWVGSGIEAGAIKTGDRMLIAYRTRSGVEEQEITLARIPCGFGGHRYFFRCPQCESRAGVLYFSRGWFLCRICSNVVYDVKNEGHYDQMLRKSKKLRSKMGVDLGFGKPVGKPRHMHWKTYWHLVLKLKAYEEQMAETVALRFGLTK